MQTMQSFPSTASKYCSWCLRILMILLLTSQEAGIRSSTSTRKARSLGRSGHLPHPTTRRSTRVSQDEPEKLVRSC